MPAKDPRDRVAIARLGGLTRSSRYDGRQVTESARQAAADRFLDLVDPDRLLPESERQRRADAARRAHMLQLARKSAEARRNRKPA